MGRAVATTGQHCSVEASAPGPLAAAPTPTLSIAHRGPLGLVGLREVGPGGMATPYAWASRGNSAVKVLPTPSSDSICSFPWYVSMVRFTSASPRPVPTMPLRSGVETR